MHNLPMPLFSFRRVSAHPDVRLHERDIAQRNNERHPASLTMGKRYRQMVALSPEALLICRAGKLVLANPAAARLLGVADPRQLNDRAVSEFIDPGFHTLFNARAAAPSVPGFHGQVWRRAR
jgi:PAS domain-containing protein